MRLIDLDKAVSICDEDNNTVIFANIKKAEVKAIPISELRRWLNKQDMPYKDYVIGVVEYAINAWEKENDKGSE